MTPVYLEEDTRGKQGFMSKSLITKSVISTADNNQQWMRPWLTRDAAVRRTGPHPLSKKTKSSKIMLFRTAERTSPLNSKKQALPG